MRGESLRKNIFIWIALTSNQHVHHSLATEWLLGIENDQIAFCRISELGFLRLLTNPHVMGKDVLSPVEAWRVYDEWRTDDRVIFLPERAEFSEEWRQLGGQITGGPNVWTDAYLAAFALLTNATIVTLDRKFLTLGKVTTLACGLRAWTIVLPYRFARLDPAERRCAGLRRRNARVQSPWDHVWASRQDGRSHSVHVPS